MSKRIEDLNTMFLRYGFLVCPLTNAELDDLVSRQWSDETIYSIGCDVAAGHPFEEAVVMALNYDEILLEDGWYRELSA